MRRFYRSRLYFAWSSRCWRCLLNPLHGGTDASLDADQLARAIRWWGGIKAAPLRVELAQALLDDPQAKRALSDTVARYLITGEEPND